MSSKDDSCDEDDRIEEGVIVPIQQSDVGRIVAGQAITDMASTVKELVDNALDAGARSINVRLFNQGVDVIEVSDDGDGVPKHSRSLMAMKHATSKLSSFDELYQTTQLPNGTMQLRQLGFRGEALFSIANISQTLVVSTRTKDEMVGEKMEFRRDGYLDPKSTCNITRKVGTTVAVVKLFEALPVRRADLIKRVKQQKAKLLKLLQEYGVLCIGVKFNVFEISGPVGSPTSKTELKLSTSEKSKSIKETISSIFGSKFLGGLCPFYVNLGDIVKKHSIDTSNTDLCYQDDTNTWRVEGLISKAPFSTSGGKGSISRDIQIFCINGRPVDMPKFSRVVTEVWRAYESSLGSASSKKRPACIVGIYLPNDMFDVNLSADKRQIMMNNENEIYEQLRIELNKLWSQQTEGQFIVNEADTSTKDSGTVKRRDDDVGNGSVKRMRDDEDKGDPVKEFNPGPTKKKNLGKIKMKRRNAFVNSFDNIGEATTDYSLEHPQNTPFRSSNGENLSHDEVSNQANESMEENEIEPCTIGQNISQQKQKSSYKGDPVMTEDEVVRRLSISCSLGNESKDSTGEERAKWDETKLRFNMPRDGSLNSLREEINTLKAMDNDKINGTFSAGQSKDNLSK